MRVKQHAAREQIATAHAKVLELDDARVVEDVLPVVARQAALRLELRRLVHHFVVRAEAEHATDPRLAATPLDKLGVLCRLRLCQ